MHKLLPIAILGASALLQACGSSPVRGDKPDTPYNEGVPTQDSSVQDHSTQDDNAQGSGAQTQDSRKIQHVIGNAAVVAMWERAEAARLTGDLEGAVAHLERAIRIDPTDSVVWSRMAQLRLQQGKYIAAENIATKSNQLNGGENGTLEYRNWLIIAQARRANGDLSGAKEAQQRAKKAK